MNRTSVWILPVVLLATASCASVRERASWLLPGTSGRLAGGVEIVRDEWGVAHISATSDAAAAFGLGYAQAEDDFAGLEALYIRALGRSANLWGATALEPDIVRAVFDVERLAREEYEREPAKRKRIWDAFALGVNHYLSRHPEVRPRLLHRFEGWQLFAIPLSRRLDAPVPGWQLDGGAATDDDVVWRPIATRVATDASSGTAVTDLAAGWAVTPDRTADDRVYVALEVAGRDAELDDLYEAHVESESGWRFSGAWLFGTPAPVAGHDGARAWSRSIDADAPAGRTHALVWTGAAGAGQYERNGVVTGVWERQVELRVNSPAGVVTRRVAVRPTEVGPVIAMHGDTAFTLDIDGFATGGLLPQLLELSRSRGFDAFAAVAAAPAPPGRLFYADSTGRIASGGTGADGASQDAGDVVGAFTVRAAPDGWAIGGERPVDAPLARLGHAGARTAALAEALAGTAGWRFDGFAALATEARYPWLAADVVRLVDVWERLGGTERERAARADAAIDMLRSFDGAVDTAAAAATLYAEYAFELAALEPGADRLDAAVRLDALARAAARVRRLYGTLDVPPARAWRLALQPADTLEDEGTRSIAVRAAPPHTGAIAAIAFRHGDGETAGRVTAARSWVMVIALGGRPEARSMIAYPRPASATLLARYAAAVLKPAPFDAAAVAAIAERRYRPGEREGGETR